MAGRVEEEGEGDFQVSVSVGVGLSVEDEEVSGALRICYVVANRIFWLLLVRQTPPSLSGRS